MTTPANVPTKSNKAVAAVAVPVVIAILTAIINNTTDVSIPPWVALAITAVLSGLAVYQTTNPATGANTNGY